MGLLDRITGKNEPAQDNLDLPAPPPDIDINGMLSQGYGEPYFRFQQENQTIESKEELLRLVMNGKLSYSCKQALTNLIMNYYDKNVMLSNLIDQNGAEVAYLYMLATIKTVSLNASDRSDTQRPEFLIVTTMLQRQTQFIFTRTHGEKRERVMSGVIQMGVEHIQKLTGLRKQESKQ